MLSSIMYKLSAFADYSAIKYSQENVSRMLAVFSDRNFLPGMVMQTTPEGVSQRIQLVNVEHTMLVTLLKERIDIEVYSNRREGFCEEDAARIRLEMADAMQRIYTLFEMSIPDAWRMAWNVDYAYFDISVDEKEAFRRRFLRELDFYRDCSTDEFIAQYAGVVPREIGSRREQMNALTTISRLYQESADGFAVDGYKIDLDINTHQSHRRNRFAGETMSEFIDRAVEIQHTLIEEIMHDVE